MSHRLLPFASILFASTALAQGTMQLAWDGVTHDDLQGYRIYFDSLSGIGGAEESVDVENGTVAPPTTVTLTGLTDCTDYYVAAQSYDAAGNVSTGYSNEVSDYPRPRLQTATPATGARGATVNVTLAGSNFKSGATVAISGAGVTVQNVVVTGCDQITLELVIALDAAETARDLTVTNPSDVATTGIGMFAVAGCVVEATPDFCARLGKDCGDVTAPDNCGTARTYSCGSCTAPTSCGGGGVANVCDCTSESSTSFCTRLGKSCGDVTAADNCGTTRTYDCGTCTFPGVCGAGVPPNVCSNCEPENDSTFCARVGKDCGTLTATDNCGGTRTVGCGACVSPASCGGAGVANECGCIAESATELCLRRSAECGELTTQDNCGVSRNYNCGGCDAPEVCGGTGNANVCGDPAACVPHTCAELTSGTCGSVDDGCGGTIDCACPTPAVVEGGCSCAADVTASPALAGFALVALLYGRRRRRSG